MLKDPILAWRALQLVLVVNRLCGNPLINNTSVFNPDKISLRRRNDSVDENMIAEHSEPVTVKFLLKVCNRLTAWHLIQSQSSSVVSLLRILSTRRMATHIVVGLAVASGLHLIATSWRKLVGNFQQELFHIEIER